MKRSFLHLLILLAFCLPLFFLNLGGWDLWNPDEPRYAEVAREMMIGRNWLIPHLNGETYYDKPPMFFWLIAMASRLMGRVDATSARLPSAFFGLMTVICVYLLGRKIRDAKAGLLSGLVLATSVEYFWLARRANIDATLTFFVTLSILLFLKGMEAKKGKTAFFSLSYLSLAFGFLTKLYPALIVFVLAIGPFVLYRRKIKLLLSSHHLVGLLGFIIPIGLWLYLVLYLEGPEYMEGLFWHKTASTFLKAYGHDRPFYYYLYNFPVDFLPWSVFLPLAFFRAWKEKERLLLPLGWFVLGFLFFSLSKAKRELYLLPLYPSASLLVGACLGNGVTLRTLFKITGILLLTTAACLWAFLPKAKAYLPNALEGAVFLSLLCAVGGTLVLLFTRKAQYEKGTFAIALTGFALYMYLVFHVLPQINPYKSWRPFSEKVLHVMERGDKLAVYRLQGAELNFYTGIVPIRRIYDPRELLEELGKGPLVCVIRKKDLQEVVEKGAKVKVVFEQKVGGKELSVVTNKEEKDAGTTP